MLWKDRTSFENSFSQNSGMLKSVCKLTSMTSHRVRTCTCLMQYFYIKNWSRKEHVQGNWLKDYLSSRDPASTKEPNRFWFPSVGCKATCPSEFTGEMPTSHLRSSAFSSKDNNHSIWSWGTRLLPDFQAQASTIQVSISQLILERFKRGTSCMSTYFAAFSLSAKFSERLGNQISSKQTEG